MYPEVYIRTDGTPISKLHKEQLAYTFHHSLQAWGRSQVCFCLQEFIGLNYSKQEI